LSNLLCRIVEKPDLGQCVRSWSRTARELPHPEFPKDKARDPFDLTGVKEDDWIGFKKQLIEMHEMRNRLNVGST
jgi:hypothetical protein